MRGRLEHRTRRDACRYGSGQDRDGNAKEAGLRARPDMFEAK